MTDKTRLAEQIAEGRDANSLLSNRILIDTLAYMKADTFQRFEGLNSNQKTEMQDCHRKLEAINDFEDRITQIITDAESALNELTVINEHEKSMKR